MAAELCRILPNGFVTSLILLAPAYFESESQALKVLTSTHFPASHVSLRSQTLCAQTFRWPQAGIDLFFHGAWNEATDTTLALESQGLCEYRVCF